jgi:hypothetical protein
LTAFINHSHENANTRVVWSKEIRHPEWRDQELNDWYGEFHTGVSIDFVALRDIQEDEEILIDYGEVWERAWREHVRTFVPREKYIPAFELNKMEHIVYRTIKDGPYEADGVQLWCRGRYVPSNDDARDKGEDSRCRILKKLEDMNRYMVELLLEPPSGVGDEEGVNSGDHTSGENVLTVSSDSFYFVDIPYTRDHHMLNSFRHAMMLPNDMFPDIWKNKKYAAASTNI